LNLASIGQLCDSGDYLILKKKTQFIKSLLMPIIFFIHLPYNY
jgi:hypothetical protein